MEFYILGFGWKCFWNAAHHWNPLFSWDDKWLLVRLGQGSWSHVYWHGTDTHHWHQLSSLLKLRLIHHFIIHLIHPHSPLYQAILWKISFNTEFLFCLNCQISCFLPQHSWWGLLIFWSLNWQILPRSGQLDPKFQIFSTETISADIYHILTQIITFQSILDHSGWVDVRVKVNSGKIVLSKVIYYKNMKALISQIHN